MPCKNTKWTQQCNLMKYGSHPIWSKIKTSGPSPHRRGPHFSPSPPQHLQERGWCAIKNQSFRFYLSLPRLGCFFTWFPEIEVLSYLCKSTDETKIKISKPCNSNLVTFIKSFGLRLWHQSKGQIGRLCPSLLAFFCSLCENNQWKPRHHQYVSVFDLNSLPNINFFK